MWNSIVEKKMNCPLISYHNGIKYLSNELQLEPCYVMFKMISDIMVHWYAMWNTIVNAINFCNAKKMICALKLIINYRHGIKCLCNLLYLEPCNVMFKLISDIMVHWYAMWNTIVMAFNFLQCKENDLCIDVYQKLSSWNKMSL